MNSGNSCRVGIAAQPPELGRAEPASARDCPTLRGLAMSFSQVGCPQGPLLRARCYAACEGDPWGSRLWNAVPRTVLDSCRRAALRCTQRCTIHLLMGVPPHSRLCTSAQGVTKSFMQEPVGICVAVEFARQAAQPVAVDNDRTHTAE